MGHLWRNVQELVSQHTDITDEDSRALMHNSLIKGLYWSIWGVMYHL